MNGYNCDEDIIQNLKDAGCKEDTIQRFMAKLQSGKQMQGVQLLQKHRCVLLDNLHKDQSRIDCLDYLLFMIKKQSKEEQNYLSPIMKGKKKMSKKVLVISTSLRKGGNSETLADEFVRGAQEAGNEVEKVSLFGKNIAFCRGCLACLTAGKCAIADDAVEIAQKMSGADVIVFATPIYYYEMCGQMKTLLDRANPLYGTDYRFRDVYMLSTAAENDENAATRAENGLQGWIDCFPKAQFTGKVFAGGVDSVGTITGHPALGTAYEMGRSVSIKKE